MGWLLVAVFGLVFAVVGMTALDKYDERSCRQNLQVIQRPNPDDDDIVVNRSEIHVFATCDGFLPW